MFRSGSDRAIHRFALWALIAVELLMSFSFLGYFHVEPISITIAYIPVLVAGAVLGPLESTIIGAVFGLASMWKASANYVMEADHLFSPFFSGYPLGSIMLSLGSRMLFGLIIGLLYRIAKKGRPAWLFIMIVSFFGKIVHSLMVFCAMALFFPEAGYGLADAFSGALSPEDILSSLAIALIVELIWLAAGSKAWQLTKRRLSMRQSYYTSEWYHSLSLILVIIVTLLSALAVTFYFVGRMEEVLSQNGIYLTDTGYTDVLHLQLQFLFGIISLMVLVILFLILNRLYNSYLAFSSRLDPLTGLMNRKAFFSACTKTLETSASQGEMSACFIMIDIDHCKSINDSYGHPEGDKALKEISKVLRSSFESDCIAGRLGGDEFALLLCRDIHEAELQHLLDRISRISCGPQSLSCSIGALRTSKAEPLEELYLKADRLLYDAKLLGRGRYMMGSS